MGGDGTERTRADSKMTAVESALKCIKEQIEGVNQNIRQMDSKITKQGSTLIKLEDAVSKIIEMEKEMQSIKAENIYLKKKMIEIETEMENQQMKGKRKQIEITGIPKLINERVTEIIKALTKDTETEVDAEDIESCYRTRSVEGRDGKIIVNFKEAHIRDKALKAIKQNKPELSKLKLEPKTRKIYANEALTAKRKYLLYRTKMIAREKGWNRVWTYAGAIFIKMEKEGHQIKLERIEDLEILIQ